MNKLEKQELWQFVSDVTYKDPPKSKITTVEQAIVAIEKAGFEISIGEDFHTWKPVYEICTDEAGSKLYAGDWTYDTGGEHYLRCTKKELIEFARKCQLKAFW